MFVCSFYGMIGKVGIKSRSNVFLGLERFGVICREGILWG